MGRFYCKLLSDSENHDQTFKTLNSFRDDFLCLKALEKKTSAICKVTGGTKTDRRSQRNLKQQLSRDTSARRKSSQNKLPLMMILNSPTAENGGGPYRKMGLPHNKKLFLQTMYFPAERPVFPADEMHFPAERYAFLLGHIAGNRRMLQEDVRAQDLRTLASFHEKKRLPPKEAPQLSYMCS